MSFPELFELVELLDITRPPEPSPSSFLERQGSDEHSEAGVGESLLEGVQQDIQRVCLKDYGEMSVLVLYCRNGHLVYRLTQRDRPTKFRIVRWFQNCWICDMCLSPDSQRLLVVCSHGLLKILPVLPLLIESYLTNEDWETRDVDTLLSLRSYGCPTCICWWSAHNAKNIGIVGFQKGNLVLVDLDDREVKRVLELGTEHTPRDLQLQRHTHNSGTSLIVVTNNNVTFCCHLEFADDHSLLSMVNGGGSNKGSGDDQAEYQSRQESSYSILSKPSDTDISPRRIQLPKESYKLYPYRQNHRSYIALLDSNDSKLLLCQDIDLLSQPLLEYALPHRTYDFLLGNNILYTLSSRGNHMYLSVLSAQMCSLLARTGESDINSALIFQIRLPSQQRVRKFFPLIAQHQAVTDGLETTIFTQCIIITWYKVYHCRHVLAPEHLFLQLASRESSMRKADKLGITLQLDICALYERSAESHLQRGNFTLALNFYKLAKTGTSKIAASLSKYDQFDLLINHLHTELASSICPDIEVKSNILFKLLIGKLLREPLPESQLELELDVRLFLHTNQHYNESEILKLLLESDLESLAIDMTLVNGIVQEFICLCAKKGRFILQGATISKILFTRFADLLATLCDGSYLQHMQLFSTITLLLKYPDTANNILPIVKSKMYLFSLSDLLLLAVMFDPSQEFVKHLVLYNQKSHLLSGRKLQHYSSMDSLNQLSMGAWAITSTSESNVLSPTQTRLEFDLADTLENMNELKPQAYFEMFIETLLWISRKRCKTQIYTQTPIREELYIQNINKLFSNFTSSHDSEKLSCNQVSCGKGHTGYILMNQVFMWTITHDHFLSPRTFTADDRHPLTVPLLSFLHIKVLEISCGYEYALARTSGGVYAWGDNTYGQLGLGDRKKRQLPSMIDVLSYTPIIALACGRYHSMLIDFNNIVSVFGDNRYGQLGIGKRDPYQNTPITLSLKVPIVEICAGIMHSLMLAPDGSVFAMGDNSYGQLGVHGLDDTTEPVRVELLMEYKVLVIASGAHTSVACGRNASEIWIWGKSFGGTERKVTDSEAQEETNVVLSKLNLDLKVGDQLKTLAIGDNHCLLLTKNGLILSWGCNDQGQCGVGSFEYQIEPKVLPINMTGVCFTSVSACSTMSAAIDSKNRCFVWGKIYPDSTISQITTPYISVDLQSDHTSDGIRASSPTECSNLPALIHDLQPEWDACIFTESERAATHELSERIPGFPDFSCLGTHSYGDEALECALRELRKFYSATRMRRLCQSMNNLVATALLIEMRGDIPGALEYRLRHVVETNGEVELATKVTELVYKHLDNLLTQNRGTHTPRGSFLNQTLLLIKSAHKVYISHSLPLSNLEEIFASRIDGLAYPLYLYIKEFNDTCETPPFTLSFCSRVTLATVRLISSGHPDPSSLLNTNSNISITRSVNEETIWGHIIHNVTKDIESSASFDIENNKVKGLFPFPENDHRVIFSCDHNYTGAEFNNTVVPKFENLLNKNLPNLDKTAIHRVVQHYRSENKFSIGCPACVFINLQRIASST